MAKPNVFNLKDALTFGLGAAIITVIAVLVCLRSDNEPIGKVVTCIIAGLSWLPYLYLVYRRWSNIEGITYETPQGLYVNVGIYTEFLEKDLVTAAVTDVCNEWFDRSGLAGTKDALRGWLLTWEPKPFSYRGKWYNGVTLPDQKVITVGFTSPISSTALSHEIAHVLYHAGTGVWDDVAMTKFAEEKHLPH